MDLNALDNFREKIETIFFAMTRYNLLYINLFFLNYLLHNLPPSFPTEMYEFETFEV